MRYATIRKQDIQNGPGIRTSIFVQGCAFHCKECFNAETWPFEGGKEFTQKEMDLLMELSDKHFIVGLSVLGGEPLHPANIDTVIDICKTFKERFKDKSIWLWSGYRYDEIVNKDILNYIDVLIDGRFIYDLRDFKLMYRGSSNQRVIDVKMTKEKGEIVLLEVDS